MGAWPGIVAEVGWMSGPPHPREGESSRFAVPPVVPCVL